MFKYDSLGTTLMVPKQVAKGSVQDQNVEATSQRAPRIEDSCSSHKWYEVHYLKNVYRQNQETPPQLAAKSQISPRRF